MRTTRNTIECIIRTVNHVAPLPKGYKYALESKVLDKTRYSLAVVRGDYQGGDFIDLPSMGSYSTSHAQAYFSGIVAGIRLLDQIKNLPPVPTKKED